MKNGRYSGPFRQSLLKLYSQCPRKFKLLEIDKVPVPEEEPSKALSVGIHVHEILHDFHKNGKIDMENYQIPEEAEPEVLELVDSYINHNIGIDVIASEQEFSFRINGFEVAGTVDLIYRNQNGQVVLRDLKTDGSVPSAEFLGRDLQFSLYFLGAIKGLGIQPDLLEWYHLKNLLPYKRKTTKNGVTFNAGDPKGNPSIPVSRKAEDITEIEKEIRYIVQGIRFNIYPQRPLKWGHICFCSYCEVADYCKPQGQVVYQNTDFKDLEGFANYY